MLKKNLFISLDGVLVQRNEKKFSIQKETEIIKKHLTCEQIQQSEQFEQSKQFPEFKQQKIITLSNDFDIEYYLSREARIPQPKDPKLEQNLSHIQTVYQNKDIQNIIDYSIVPKAKNTLQNLGITHKRVLIIQSVWHDRINTIFSKFKDQFDQIIDAYLFIPAENGALAESISSFLKQQDEQLVQQEDSMVFVSNSLAQLLEIRKNFKQMKTIFFNRNISPPSILENFIKENSIDKCIYNFSSMTMINLERLVRIILQKVKSQDYEKLPRVGLLYTRHKNTIAKWDKVNSQNYLLNDENMVISYIDLYLPLGCQQQVDLIIHKLSIHYTPYDLENSHLQVINQKYKDMQKKVRFYEEPEQINLVSGRSYFKLKLDKILEKQSNKKSSNFKLKNPKWFLVSKDLDPYTNQSEFLKQISAGMQKSQMSYPIIIQSDNATTHPSSHNLAIVKSDEGLQKFIDQKYFQLPRDGPNLIIQQFIEHNASILKIYMLQANQFFGARIDKSITVVKMKEDEVFYLGQSEKELGFGDKLLQEDKDNIKQSLHKLLGNVVNQFGINLVGFDVIRKVGSQEFYIIDINHFPSFDKLPEFPSKFKEVLINIAKKEHDMREIQSQLD